MRRGWPHLATLLLSITLSAMLARGAVVNPVTSGGGTTIYQAVGRLSFVSSTSIKFCPFNGNQIIFPSASTSVQTIPSACTTAANTSVFIDAVSGQNLAASTTYL